MDCSHQAPLSMGFYCQEYWSGLPLPSLGDLPNPGIKPTTPPLQADSLPSEPPGKRKFLILRANCKGTRRAEMVNRDAEIPHQELLPPVGSEGWRERDERYQEGWNGQLRRWDNPPGAPTTCRVGGMKGECMLPKPWSPACIVRARTMAGTQVLLKMLPEAETNGQKCPVSLFFLLSHLCHFPSLLKLTENQLGRKA